MHKTKKSLQTKKNFKSNRIQQFIPYYVMWLINLPTHHCFATTHGPIIVQKVLNLKNLTMYLNLAKEEWMKIGMMKAT